MVSWVGVLLRETENILGGSGLTSSRLLCALGLILSTLCGCASLHPPAEPRPLRPLAHSDTGAFSLIVLPDTQKYVETEADFELFTAQTSWIAANRDKLNIAFVLHSGDIVQNSDRDSEWKRAQQALSLLDDQVPYVLAVGNHDLDGPSTFFRTRGTRAYNNWFPASKFERRPWYGDRQRDDENDNYYVLFEHGDLKFLIVSLEFAPPDDVLAWANQVVSKHSDRRVIVLTHCYLHTSGERVTDTGLTNPHNFHLPEVNDGEQMWRKFVSRHANIFLVVSGHCHGTGRLTSVGVHGNEVHQVLSDFQATRRGGHGWLRIMQFSPQANTVSIKTFSPYLNAWLTDSANEFVLTFMRELHSAGAR